MNKPLLNLRISYYTFDKDISEYKSLYELSNQNVLLIIDELYKNLENKELDYRNDYYTFYNLYQQPLPFEVFYKAKKEDAAHNLKMLRDILTKNTAKPDLSTLQMMYLNYRYNTLFKKDWFLNPEILFSNDFYKTAITENSADILFNSYQYDGYNNNRYLPVYKTLSNNDIYVIQPHYINSPIARTLLSDTQLTNKNAGTEAKLFVNMLNKVLNNEVEVIVCNDDF